MSSYNSSYKFCYIDFIKISIDKQGLSLKKMRKSFKKHGRYLVLDSVPKE